MVAPEITRVTPSSILSGSASFRMDIYGTGITSNTDFTWNFSTTGITKTFVDSGHIYVTVDSSLITADNSYLIVLNDPEDGQGTIKIFTSDSSNSLPSVSLCTPAHVTKNTGPWTVYITGSGYEFGQSVIYYDGVAQTTYWDTSNVASGTSIYCVIANEPSAGTHSIDVRTPAPGGGNSSGVNFYVDEPVYINKNRIITRQSVNRKAFY